MSTDPALPRDTFDLLIPRPRSCHAHGWSPISADPIRTLARAHGLDEGAWRRHAHDLHVTHAHDAALPAGGYRLHIPPDPSLITLAASSEEGFRNARATLVQLARACIGSESRSTQACIGSENQSTRTLPACEIDDAPALPIRGVMLDVSRLRVPTMTHLLGVIDQLALLKFNHVQLYIEHAFRYRGHAAVSDACSPITPDELQRLDEYCRARGLTLAANQNCFGHMHRWLACTPYADLAETHADWYFQDMHRTGAFSLCPTDPRSLALVDDLIAQQLACVSSNLFNIGCDETYDVGQGRSREAVERHGRAHVYGSFVAQVCERVTSRGARPMFWADIALEHPETLDLLPDQAIALAWSYEPSAAFADWCRTCRAHGHETWVCPGTSSWRSITGRTAERRANIARAVQEGLENGAQGMLVCDWGDAGHLQQWPVALHALAYAADVSWTGDADPDRNVAPAESLQIFNDHSLQIGAWLDALGDADVELRTAMATPPPGAITLHNATVLFTSLWPAREGYVIPDDAAMWSATRERLAALRNALPISLTPLLHDQLEHSLRFATFAAAVGEAQARGLPLPPNWQSDLDHIARDHQRLWHITSRPGGLADSARNFDTLRTRLLARHP